MATGAGDPNSNESSADMILRTACFILPSDAPPYFFAGSHREVSAPSSVMRKVKMSAFSEIRSLSFEPMP